ncbi:MAG: HK97 gp10 family phage protein [Candidatus Hodarchaeales archaeon]
MVTLNIRSNRIISKSLKEKIVRKILFAWGSLIVIEIQRMIEEIPLKDGSEFWQGIHHWVDDDLVLNIASNVEYAKYLEYGTYTYFKISGLGSFPEQITAKKKDLSRKERKGLPKGMQPFAPFRRVLYSQSLMDGLFVRAVRNVVPSML